MTDVDGLERAKELWGWSPHSDGQREWMLCDTPVKVASCGRRWGKSESTAIDIVLFALSNPGSIQMVIAPTADQTGIIMEEVSGRLRDAEDAWLSLRERRSPYHHISVTPSGIGDEPPASTICGRTASFDGRGVRGRKAHRIVVDEAAFVPDEVMESVITPLLADYNGQLVLISTPSGRNHFWRSYERGLDLDQLRCRSFHFASSDNPLLSVEFLESERATKPDRVWRTEYMAEFGEADGAVFRNVAACCDGEWELPVAGKHYAAGLDLGRLNDYTVLCVFDVASRRLVHMDRFNGIDWTLQVVRIAEASRRYNGASVLVEANNVGDVLLEQIQRAGVRAVGFTTTSPSKVDLIDALVVAFEKHEIHLPDMDSCRVLVDELSAFEYKRSATHLAMGAPPGLHDDCVMSLALAWKHAGSASVRPIAGPRREYALGPERAQGRWRG